MWFYKVSLLLDDGSTESSEVGPFLTRGEARVSINHEGEPYEVSEPFQKEES